MGRHASTDTLIEEALRRFLSEQQRSAERLNAGFIRPAVLQPITLGMLVPMTSVELRAWAFVVALLLVGLALFRVLPNRDRIPWNQPAATICLNALLEEHERLPRGPGVHLQDPVPAGPCAGFRVTTKSTGQYAFITLELGGWVYTLKRSEMVVRVRELTADAPEVISWRLDHRRRQ